MTISSSVIVIDYMGFNTGLVVEEIYGMRHFRDVDITNDIPVVHEKISSYIDHVYKEDEERWSVFDVSKLAKDKRLINIKK